MGNAHVGNTNITDQNSSRKSLSLKKHGNHLTDFIFSWSLEDILNHNLYKDQVEKIPDSFDSTDCYFSSFVIPLLEEIRAEVCSKLKGLSDSPFVHLISVRETTPFGKQVYDVKLDNHWTSSSDSDRNEPFREMPGPGDIVVFSNDIPNAVSDLEKLSWCFGYIVHVNEAASFKIKASQEIVSEDGVQRFSVVIFLMNLTTNKRIWDSLHSFGDSEMVKEVLSIPPQDQSNCKLCPKWRNQTIPEILSLSSDLNESQYEAVSACKRKIKCNHKPNVELIWGPPGTGKTKTISVLLFSLLKMKYRTLICAPTNMAIIELASRAVKVVRGEHRNVSASSLGNILLFCNKEHINSDIEDIYLDYRIEKLLKCLGWKQKLCLVIKFLEETDEFMSKRDEFRSMVSSLKSNISDILTHLTYICILPRKMESLNESLYSFEELLWNDLFFQDVSRLLCVRDECLCALRSVKDSLDGLNLPSAANRDLLEEFCLRNASLIFCTASNSHKLLSMRKDPIKCLVIDEASQLKECESMIPIQIPGVRHIVLVGDEYQLAATVNSKVSQEAGFGRSLFERLSLLGRSKHLLDIQYRMHPSISSFPNSKFYQNRIVDAPSVKRKSYEKSYLPHPMFGPYSFINISGGKELIDGAGSRKNFVEVAVVLKILQLLYKACDKSNEKISVGVVSPYSAQVAAIQQKIGQKFERNVNFSVKVRSIDGCQGREEDVIIISTVRSNRGGSVGFLSNPPRTNVALTRARHALWILGNERTLCNSGSIWEDVVVDAKDRNCFFHANEDKNLAKVILDVQKELGHLDDLLDGDSSLFRNAKWKILFSDNFRKSFARLRSLETKNLTLLMLSKLANGWRPKGHVGVASESSSEFLKQYKVGGLYILCSVDIVKESWYVQALKVWDILGLQDIEKLVKRLEGIFKLYTHDYLERCKLKCFHGDLEVPMTWPASLDIVQFRSLDSNENKEVSDDKYFENTKVRDSLLLMKFYSFSSGAVQNMISSCDGGELGLPFELTEQEKEVVFFEKSSFILGRSGTGKTTVLTMKLFQNEQLFHLAAEGFHKVNGDPSDWKQEFTEKDYEDKDVEDKDDVLHQLFVTVSPKLCYAVNQHVNQLKRTVCGGKSSAQSSSVHMDDIDDATQFSDIPDSFVGLSPDDYPLVITFHKFLLMLDGTVGSSYFDRFPDVRVMGKMESRSVVLNTFIRTNEVTFDKFDSSYWSHFSNKLTKNLDSSTVFTEIMSVIKGGLEEGNAPAGKLSQQDYVSLADNRGSSISMKIREMIYCIYLEYEKKKVENGEFDLADLVIDLHHRLKQNIYVGDEMDFVYIDEVQDLSMRQIALFKFICKNVDQGFVFAGDTAQTIAKGIDFRFEDIRCLFYKEFIFGYGKDKIGKRSKDKGKVSRIFHLSQNFRTHAAVLKLAQSVINLIYHYFPLSIDILSPEISLLRGEAPVLLGTVDKKNVLKSIFEKKGDAGARFVGFGAEQVILVRDQKAKKEVCEQVEQNALVLTITECKGLEFQDVLLYNFFSASSLKDAWRVVYEYMKEKELLNSENFHVAVFNQEKHNVLCSELKQLYVAITRTKQRLWICDDFHLPMFDYWKRLCLVQERNLDESFIMEMQVCSSTEEWRTRGIKLFYEQHYGTALMCFERAGDMFWQTMAKASELRATALRSSNSYMSEVQLKKAAELFHSIGKAESAAQCYLEMKDYKRAGMIYLESFGDTKLEKAGECFSMAKSFKLAAEAYARGRLYSKSLSSCIDGKLFDMGLNLLEDWKQYDTPHGDRIVEDFLDRGARHYFELNQKSNMMMFVKSFLSMNSMRTFLRTMNCLDELLLLEEEWGNFLEAAEIARIKKECLREADLREKAGVLREASTLVLWYVFSGFLTPQRIRGKAFVEKDALLKKAKSTAMNHSDSFYKFVSTLADLLSKWRTLDEDPETGLKFVQYWKDNAPADLDRVKTSDEVLEHEQDLLGKCARHYHRKNDRKIMMKYVEALESVESKRSLLKALNCLDELLLLEEKEGNFLIAAKIAEKKGDIIREFNLLEKAGHYEEGSLLMLSYVLALSLWAPGNRGWPLKEFSNKGNLLKKAVSCSSHHSNRFHEFVSTEVKVLTGLQCSLSDMRDCLISSQRNNSCSGEILSARKILDAHLCTSPHNYEWDNLLVDSVMKHDEYASSQVKFSAYTLFSIWNHWKEKIVRVADCFCNHITSDGTDFTRYKEFCLKYLGVRKHWSNQDTRYIVLNPSAIWLNEIDSRSIQRSVQITFVDIRHIEVAAQKYWSSVLLSVCIDVLVTLKSLYIYSEKSSLPLFQKSIILLYIFEVVKFLKEYNFPGRRYSGIRTPHDYLQLSIHNFLDNVFCMDWKKSSKKEMISLRRSESSVELLKEAISRNIISTDTSTYGRMGQTMMLVLASGQLKVDLNEKIIKSFGGKSLWMEFFEKLIEKRNSDVSGSWVSLVSSFCEVLRDTFEADWRTEVDYMSPSCFIYLLERLLIFVFCFRERFFTTRSACLEWLIYKDWKVNSNVSSVSELEVEIQKQMVYIISELLVNKDETLEWIKKSHTHSADCYHQLLVTRLVVLLCLICVNSGGYFDSLFSLLGKSDIQSLLPVGFYDALCGGEESHFVHGLADALEMVENPLVIMSLGDAVLEYSGSSIIFVNQETRTCSTDELIESFFKEKCNHYEERKNGIRGEECGQELS